MARTSSFTSLATALGSIAQHYGMEAKLLEHRLHRSWSQIAGEQIAAHTRPDTIRFKKLYLIAESSVWLQHLTFLRPSLIEKINAAAGSTIVSDIVLRVGEVADGRAEEQTQEVTESQEAVPAPESLAQAAAYAEGVSDPDLRAQLTTVMAKALALGPTRTPNEYEVP